MRNTFNTLTVFAALFLALGPAYGKDYKISKVKIEEVSFTRKLITTDPMIEFERQYLLHGAITAEEYMERQGKYYTVFWKAKDRSPGLMVRFEYIQANTGSEIHVKEVTVDKVKRLTNVTHFQVTGQDYNGGYALLPDGTPDTATGLVGGGDVLAWRASLVRNGAVVATTKSFLWK